MTSASKLLFESADRYPERPALIVDGRVHTYSQLALKVRARSRALRASGAQSGTRVALLMENGADFVAAYYAVLATGAAVVPLNPLLAPRELVHALCDSSPVLLLSTGALEAVGAEVAGSAGVAHCAWDEVPTDHRSATEPKANLSDEAVIIYTSGTTGTPKGAVLTHSNLLWNAWISASSRLFDFTPDDVILAALPLFHAYGQTCIMNAGLLSGSSLVLMTRFQPDEALDLMERHNVSVFEGVPTMYVGLLEAARRRPDHRLRLRLCASGGAPLPAAVMEAFEAEFGAAVYEGYGLSETSPMVCFNQPDFPRRPGTVGRPVWGVSVEIAQQDVADRVELLPSGERGEVVIKGHNVFAGYLGNPAATAEVMVEGWFRTGDIGIKDEAGYLTIVDRKKDLIIRGGYNVYPREVEEVLVAHPAVADGVVIGRPDYRYGEEVVAVVRLAAGHETATPEEILDWMASRVAKYKRPREILIRDELPSSATGKVLRRTLIQTLFGGSLESPSQEHR